MKKKKERPTKEKIRVMVVDDHALLREVLRKLINLQPDLEVVAEANGGRVALQLLPQTNPDVVLMDGSMPEMNGIEATSRLRKLQPDIKIIALTLYEQTMYLEEMVAMGASGFVLKTAEPTNLLEAIRTIAAGGTYFDPAIPQRSAPIAAAASNREELTADELKVAKRLANGQTSAEIAASLGLNIPAVEAHRSAALKKLGLSSRAGLVRVAAQRRWLDS